MNTAEVEKIESDMWTCSLWIFTQIHSKRNLNYFSLTVLWSKTGTRQWLTHLMSAEDCLGNYLRVVCNHEEKGKSSDPDLHLKSKHEILDPPIISPRPHNTHANWVECPGLRCQVFIDCATGYCCCSESFLVSSASPLPHQVSSSFSLQRYRNNLLVMASGPRENTINAVFCYAALILGCVCFFLVFKGRAAAWSEVQHQIDCLWEFLRTQRWGPFHHRFWVLSVRRTGAPPRHKNTQHKRFTCPPRVTTEV